MSRPEGALDLTIETETPSEIERIIKLWKCCCPTNGGEVERNDADLVRIPKILECSNIYKGKKCYTIYRVPREIYSCDEKAYQPKAVCIGPFFYCQRKEQHLKSMQDYKYVCVYNLISHCNRGNREDLVARCLSKMEELHVRVRNKYSESFPSITCEKFTKMLMLDGCFLLHLLVRYASVPTKVCADDAWQLVGRMWTWSLVKYDLLLLQNQVPFFVIRSLYDILMPHNNNICLVQGAINLFSALDPCRKQGQTKFFCPAEEVHHLLHLIYLSILPCPQSCERSREQQTTYLSILPCPQSCERSCEQQSPQWIPSASELEGAEIKFKKRKNEQQSPQWIPSATELEGAGIEFKERKNTGDHFLSFLDIRFYRTWNGGVIEIPQLKVHDYSVSLFRNLIAFEQCYPVELNYITVYAAFMNFLTDTEKDVRSLRLKDVLINNMTVDKNPTHFFSRLCSEVHYAHDRNYLRGLFKKVTAYYNTKCHRLRAQLIRMYFPKPWSIIAAIAGALSLLFSFIQLILRIV